MNGSHTDITATQRLTISLPWYLAKQVKQKAPDGNVSRYIAGAVEKKVAEDLFTNIKKSDPWKEFLALRGTLPKVPYRQIRAAINKGRM